MKKIFVSAIILAAMSFFAFAKGSVKADDFTVGEIKPGKTLSANGFTINGADKGVKVEDRAVSPVKNGDKVYKKRIQTKSSAGFIEFEAKAGDVVKVTATSASKEAMRSVLFTDKNGKKLQLIEAPVWNASSPSFTNETFTVPSDGIYHVKGVGGGIYFFEISVE